MILADTPVWIDHLASTIPDMTRLLRAGAVRMHPFVIGEVLLGNIKDPARVRGTLTLIRTIETASHDDVLSVIQRHALGGSGVGYVDAHFLAAVMLSPPCKLWTRDKRLKSSAERLGVAAAGLG